MFKNLSIKSRLIFVIGLLSVRLILPIHVDANGKIQPGNTP